MKRLLCGAVLLWGSIAAGCISSTAGYRDAKAVLRERTGVTVHPAIVDDEDSAKVVRDLLSQPITADSAARIALLHSPEVQAAFDRIGVARGHLVAAVRLPNPRVEGALRFRSGGHTDVVVGGSINLMDLILLPLREEAASSGLDAASLEAVGTAMDVAFEARTAYYDCVATEQSLELAKSVLIATEAASDLAKKLDEAGNVSPLEALNQRALYEEARVTVAQAETQRTQSRERLNAALGLWGPAGVGWSVPAQFDEPSEKDVPVADAERRAIDRSLELSIARHRYAGAAHEANAARAQGVLPELNVGVDTERLAEVNDQWGVGPKVGLGIPLFYQGQGAVDASRAEMSRQKDLTEGLAIQIRSEARALAVRVKSARELTSYYKDTLLPLRQRIVDETELHYNAMSVSAFQLLAAKRSAVDTTRSYVDALHEYWGARAALDLLLSGRLTRPLAHDFGLGVRTGGAGAGE